MPEINFISYLKSLKPEDWNKKVTDKWTVKEVVAHMIGWERGDPEIIKSTWKTKQAPWFTKTKDYDDFNQKNIEYYKNYKPAELIEEWEKWQQKVKEETEHIGKDKLKTRLDLFGWLFNTGENNHYNLHYQQIKSAVNKK
jgi:hypothetical protein